MPNDTTPFPRRNGKNRTEHACEQCRQRKRRCDGDYPCNCCKEGMLVCRYTSKPSNKTGGMFIQLNRKIDRLSRHQKVLVSRIEILEARLEYNTTTLPCSQHVSWSHYPTYKASRFLQLAYSSTKHSTGQYGLIRLWPSLLPLLQSANVRIESDYVFWLERYRSPQTSVSQPPSTTILHADSAQPSPRVSSEAIHLLNGRCHLNQRLAASEIRSLFAEYERHVHILLPFLDIQGLRLLCDNFVNWRASRLSECDYPLRQRYATNVVDHEQSNSISGSPVGQCLEHALAYVVIALGQITGRKRPVETGVCGDLLELTVFPMNLQYNAGYQRYGSPEMTKWPQSTDAASSSTGNSKADEPWSTLSAASTLPSPIDSKYEASSSPIDLAVSGDEYATAQRTLEECPHNDDLLLAQIYLLMGLYNGQLAFAAESMKWYCKAGKLLLLLLDRYNLYADETSSQGGLENQYRRTQDRIKGQRHNLIVLASWTGLQLEGDTLTELDLPSSGLQNVQHLLPMPVDFPRTYEQNISSPGSTVQANEDRNDTLIHFTAQSFLQRRINIIQRQLYGREYNALQDIQDIIHSHQETLDHWQERLPEGLRWDTSNPPPSDILAARLQARYWHAQYTLTRPFLDFVLHILPHLSNGRAMEDVAFDAQGEQRSSAEIQVFTAIQSMHPDTVLQACERCIEAAARSTIVFDWIPGPSIVVNIHGVAHAQFSIMLVLAACWQDSRLHKVIEQWSFPALLDRTIASLGELADLSPTCRADYDILFKLKLRLFG